MNKAVEYLEQLRTDMRHYNAHIEAAEGLETAEYVFFKSQCAACAYYAAYKMLTLMQGENGKEENA